MSGAPLLDTRVFLTGATGFLGLALIHALLDAGAQVTALARSHDRAAPLLGLDRVHVVYGDIREPDALAPLLTGHEIVVHAAAALGGTAQLQATVNVTGTANVARAAVHAGVRRIVLISTVGVYGYRPAYLVREDHARETAARSPYNRTKAQAEAALQRALANQATDFAIIRPGTIYGPGGGLWTRGLYNWARRGPILFPGDGRGSMPLIHVRDVCELVLKAATLPAAQNQSFNCVMDPAPTWRDVLMAYARLAGRQPRWIGLPRALTSALALLAESIAEAAGAAQELPAVARYASEERRYSIDNAKEMLGWSPQIDLETGIESCRAYLTGGQAPQPDTSGTGLLQ